MQTRPIASEEVRTYWAAHVDELEPLMRSGATAPRRLPSGDVEFYTVAGTSNAMACLMVMVDEKPVARLWTPAPLH